MDIPLHSQLRKKLRKWLYIIFSLIKRTTPTDNYIDKKEIKQILIVRPNYRIGNIIFLTPLINELEKHIPDVTIDIIVGMKLAGQILEPMPNVRSVIDIPRKLLLHPLKLLELIKKTRKEHYDLILNVSSGSVSSEIVTALSKARYKASFENDKSLIHFTHTVENENRYKHFASRPLELLKLFGERLPVNNVPLDIKLTFQERESAKTALQNIIQENNIPNEHKIVALFRNARFDKKISDEWWNSWHKELLNKDTKITVIDILSPDILVKLNKDMLEYSTQNLRLLGAFFAECDLYVSADTGPLHLASASDAKVLALFNNTDPNTYGILEAKSKNIEVNGLSTDDVAKICQNMLVN